MKQIFDLWQSENISFTNFHVLINPCRRLFKKIVNCMDIFANSQFCEFIPLCSAPQIIWRLQLSILMMLGCSFSSWQVLINFKTSQFTLGPSVESGGSFERSRDFVASISLSKRFFKFRCSKNLESKYLEHATLEFESQNLTQESIC